MDNWNWGSILFAVRGRINRAKFWAVYLIANLASGFVLQLTVGLIESAGGMGDPVHWIGVAATLALIVFMAWVSLAITVKRLHDRGKSGWWLLLFYGLPLGVGLVGTAASAPTWPMIAFIVAISTWLMIELGFLRGTAGPNAYGPDPLAEAEEPPQPRSA